MDLFSSKEYIDGLKNRAQKSRVHHNHQFLGLEIANILGDFEHKSLYIKLAKEHDGDELLHLAKDVADRRDVERPGAYFMHLIQEKYGDSKNKQQRGR
ncbi:MAG: hypothetical protein R3B52_00965 [Candidatus Paceibacterota bacterium]